MYCVLTDGSSFTEVPCDTPNGLIVMTRVELAQHSPFYMDTESAGAIGGALLLVMAVAWGLRQLRQTLSLKESE